MRQPTASSTTLRGQPQFDTAGCSPCALSCLIGYRYRGSGKMPLCGRGVPSAYGVCPEAAIWMEYLEKESRVNSLSKNRSSLEFFWIYHAILLMQLAQPEPSRCVLRSETRSSIKSGSKIGIIRFQLQRVFRISSDVEGLVGSNNRNPRRPHRAGSRKIRSQTCAEGGSGTAVGALFALNAYLGSLGVGRIFVFGVTELLDNDIFAQDVVGVDGPVGVPMRIRGSSQEHITIQNENVVPRSSSSLLHRSKSDRNINANFRIGKTLKLLRSSRSKGFILQPLGSGDLPKPRKQCKQHKRTNNVFQHGVFLSQAPILSFQVRLAFFGDDFFFKLILKQAIRTMQHSGRISLHPRFNFGLLRQSRPARGGPRRNRRPLTDSQERRCRIHRSTAQGESGGGPTQAGGSGRSRR